MQRLATPIRADLSAPRSTLAHGSGVSGAARSLSLSDTLRRDLSGPLPAAGALGSFVRGRSVGRVDLLEAAGSSLRISIEGASNAARVMVLIQIEGSAIASQGDRHAELGPGDLCLLRGARPLDLDLRDGFRIALVDAPEDEIVDRFPLWRAAMLVPIRGTSGVPAVFCDAVRSVHRWQDSMTDLGTDGLANALIDLMGSLVCFAVPTTRDCLRQSLFQKDRIKKAAQLNLRNPDLDVDMIAESVGLSPRQVHRLFADEGMSLMRWVWVQRLEQCYRELSQEDQSKRSISDVAYTWGFNDQAHFSRAFRKHFGVSPRDVRRGIAASVAIADAAG